ncbi:hypothetical protein D1BOALGB6SA_2946 [Olavius sp. associated proteobacterium Delta 1]|nr:hypothetical protein D1BOALGB6SA_2946 [Olavius sp. associated proteobacterium Delta 1]
MAEFIIHRLAGSLFLRFKPESCMKINEHMKASDSCKIQVKPS